MGRKTGSKNKVKNINTAKNKNVININVNSTTSKRRKGRPRKTTNDTTQNRQSGGSGMAPPQIIISPPQPQQDNSLLSSFITSKMLNESNLLNSRTNMTAIEPTREQPSYFNARESIIPRIPETPIKQEIRQEVKPPPISKQQEIRQEVKPPPTPK